MSRHKLSDTLQTFDFPDPAIHCARRADTTTPLQQMFVLNSPFMREQAAALADRLQQNASETFEQRINFAHRLLFARDATPTEVAIAREFLPEDPPAPIAETTVSETPDVSTTTEKSVATAQARWARYSHALLSNNEFLYID